MSSGRLALALAALLLPAVASAQADAERARTAKALFVDREYAQARQAWQAVRASGRGPDVQAAQYWIARCSESLGESERALAEYGEYLASAPSDRTLAEEARTSRVALAVKLYRGGKPAQLPVARDALSDPSRTVRYFAALQLASLGPEAGRPAVPVLKEILAREKDPDLVDRAKLALLRVEPGALQAVPSPAPHRAGQQASWIRVRIYEKGDARAKVSINLPVALAELVFKSLPDETRAELKKKGYDAGNFWDRLKHTGPTDILTIEGDEGERVQVWIE
jgi:tetratricopeptide (TPR) repeat protein